MNSRKLEDMDSDKPCKTATGLALNRLRSVLTDVRPTHERKVKLHHKLLKKAYDLLKESGAESVLDIGCGEGKLLKILIKEGQFKKIAGMDVALGELQKAKRYLNSDQVSPALSERLNIFQGSVFYKDERLKGFNAVAMIEVIEHLDEDKLPSMENVVFGFANPSTIVLSTPNAEYNNVVSKKMEDRTFRHSDHRFEWTRKEFADWCNKICTKFNYEVEIYPVGKEQENKGSQSQLALFKKK